MLTHLFATCAGLTVGLLAGPSLYHHRLKAYMRRLTEREAQRRGPIAAAELAQMIAELDN